MRVNVVQRQLLTAKAVTRAADGPPAADRRGLTPALRATALGIAVALTVGLTSVHTQERSREYEIKAALVFNFIRFVDWPPPASDRGPLTPLTVCVLGPDSVGDAFAAIDGRRTRNRTIAFTHLETTDDISACKVIFVEGAAGSQVTNLLPHTGGTPVLTVGETTGFIPAGGIIAFAQDGKKLRFEINLAAAERAGITIHSELLRLASNIRTATHEE